MLVTSSFSFSPNDFHNYISLVRQNAALCGNGLKTNALYFGEKLKKTLETKAELNFPIFESIRIISHEITV